MSEHPEHHHHPHPTPGGAIRIALQPGIPLGRRLREIAVNLSRRRRDRRFHDCCGNYGEPGC